MQPYDTLDREVLCFTLVGQFLWRWSMLEQSVDEALGNALNLSYSQMMVLSAHIPFMSKLRVLTGAVTVATFDAAKRKQYHSVIDSIPPLYADRNIVAHHQFGPMTGKRGVTFFTKQTKKTVQTNEVFWADYECLLKFDRMDKAEKAIADLSLNLETDKHSFGSRLAALFDPGLSSYGAKAILAKQDLWLKDLIDASGVPDERRYEISEEDDQS